MLTPDQVPWANERSSRATIRAGRRFTFRDRLTQERRVGYFDRRNGRLTVLDEAETYIVTHFRCDEGYVRACPESDYVRYS